MCCYYPERFIVHCGCRVCFVGGGSLLPCVVSSHNPNVRPLYIVPPPCTMGLLYVSGMFEELPRIPDLLFMIQTVHHPPYVNAFVCKCIS